MRNVSQEPPLFWIIDLIWGCKINCDNTVTDFCTRFFSAYTEEESLTERRRDAMFVQSQHYVEVTSEVASSGIDEGIVHIKHASPHSSAVSTKSKYTGDDSL